ncbi:MAG: efflux RND transporter periplasmic adaptor subunit [Bacteroidota bacterium]
MTKQLIVLGLGTLLVLSSCTKRASNGSKDNAHPATAQSVPAVQEYYTCPMHPTVISDRPGACPVCGMTLVRKTGPVELSSDSLAQLQSITLSPTQRVLANVSTAVVERHPLNKVIDLVGVVDVAESNQATVSARFRGRIEKLYVNFTGEVVTKGQPLFELYSPDLLTSEQEFILALDGHQQNMIQGMRDRLQTHFGMTAEQIAELESSRKVRTTIQFKSPIHGTVLYKQVQEGQYVDEGTVLYQLADLSKVWIYLDVYERDVSYIKIGQPVYITSEAYPDDTFAGRVTFVDPVMNGETRTVRVRTEFSNLHGKLKPKMYVTAQVTLPLGKTLVVPSGAVLSTGKRTLVWVEIKPNTFEPRNVVVGQSSDNDTEVLEGLAEGEHVASTGGFLIDSESALREPSASTVHAAHQPSAVGQEAEQKTVADVQIHVKGKYMPAEIRVKQGQPVKLHFYRDETDPCTSEVVFEELNIHRNLPAWKTTTIEIFPKEVGEIHFGCGMGMVHGKLIVEE